MQVTAMEILRRCRSAAADVAKMQQKIDQRRDALTCIAPSGTTPSGKNQGAASKDKTGTLIADIDELEQALKDRKNQQLAETMAVLVLLDLLPKTSSDVLYRYYIKRQSIPRIAVALSYTDGYVRKVKADAEGHLSALSEKQVAEALPAWYLREVKGK